jgi:hypothetical protein
LGKETNSEAKINGEINRKYKTALYSMKIYYGYGYYG